MPLPDHHWRYSTDQSFIILLEANPVFRLNSTTSNARIRTPSSNDFSHKCLRPLSYLLSHSYAFGVITGRHCISHFFIPLASGNGSFHGKLCLHIAASPRAKATGLKGAGLAPNQSILEYDQTAMLTPKSRTPRKIYKPLYLQRFEKLQESWFFTSRPPNRILGDYKSLLHTLAPLWAQEICQQCLFRLAHHPYLINQDSCLEFERSSDSTVRA